MLKSALIIRARRHVTARTEWLTTIGENVMLALLVSVAALVIASGV